MGIKRTLSKGESLSKRDQVLEKLANVIFVANQAIGITNVPTSTQRRV
jgi:hypothetical protein